jgi:hypothetical protein
VSPNAANTAQPQGEDFRITNSLNAISSYQPNHDHNFPQNHIAVPRNNT